MSEELEKMNELALAHYISGDTKKALQYFFQALHFIDPSEDRDEEENILINIAQIYDEINKDRKALQVYKWIWMRYDDPVGLYGMALIYEKNKQYGDALTYYHKAVEVDPDYRDAMFFLANLYDVTGDKEEAVKWYKETMKRHPDDYMAPMNLGVIYESEGDYDKAKELFQKSVDIEPAYFRSRFNLGVAYKALGQQDKALEQYILAKELMPEYGDVYLNISALLIEQERYEESEVILSEGIEEVPEEANLYYNRACVRVKLGKTEGAVEDGKKSAELNPDIVPYIKTDEDLAPVRDKILR